MPEAGRPAARWRRWAVILAVTVGLYAVTGFFVVPRVLQRQLEHRVADALRRPVSIARVRANPFTLSVTIDGFLVRERDGSSPFLSWDRLFLNARVLPVFRGEFDLDAVSLSGFQVHVSMGPDARLNCEDILEAYSTDPAPKQRPKRKNAFVFGVDRLSIDKAQIVFVDRSRVRPFQTTLGPVTVSLRRFRTRSDSASPYAFTGVTEAGERFSWSGTLLIDPLRSSGEFSFEDVRFGKYAPYYEQQVGFEFRQGRWGIHSRYQLEWGATKREVRLSDGALRARDLVVAARGADRPAVELPEVDVTGIGADVLGRTAEVGLLSIRGGTVRAHRDRDGQLDIAKLVPPPSPAESGQRPPFRWNLGRVSAAGCRVELEDGLPDRPVELVLAPIDLELRNIASEVDAVTQLELTAGWNGTGRVAAKGSVLAHRPAADLRLRVSAIDLVPLDPYLALYGGLEARITRGQLGIDGRLRVDRGVEPMSWAFDGSVSAPGLALADSARGEELVRWKQLALEGIASASAPPGLTVASVRVVEPRVRLHVAPDRSTNLRRVLGVPAAEPPRQAATSSHASSGPPAYPVSIGSVQIVRGRAGMVDRSVRPAAVLDLTEVDARLRNLSNQVTARSTVQVRALVSGAPLEVKGTLSPRLVNDATDLAIRSKGIDLTPLAPYFGKHVGYVLEKGKLDLDLAYQVKRRNLEGKNVARIDQLTLGDKTDSPDATSMPVKLGLAILRDKDGVVDLDVPVSGNIDDPSFSLGKMIWHAIGNVFEKLVTAPFAALGKLFGGGSEQPLDVVEFAPGTSEVVPAGANALETLAKALGARPGLRLEIEGTADDRSDGRALRLRELRKRARQAKRQVAAAHAREASSDQLELTDAEYRSWVATTFRSAPSATASAVPAKAVGGRAVPETPAFEEMEAGLLEAVVVPPEDYTRLAQQRSEAIRQRLTSAKPPVNAERLFLTRGGERATKEGGARAYFTLK